MSLTPSERRTRARAAAYALHAMGKTNTGPATVAQLARYSKQVDPDSILEPAERARRAEYALKSHMTLLSLAASRARTKKSGISVIEPSEIPLTTEVRDGSATSIAS